MAENVTKDILQPATLQEAINIIKFLKTSHKQEVTKLKEANAKQNELIKKLETNRKKELEFLSNELQKYEANLALRTETVAQQLEQKDIIIESQTQTIEELKQKLKSHGDHNVSAPEINILVDSNSDSGVALEHDESVKVEHKTEMKAIRKCSRRFGETISFLRRVDFSPMKYKPCRDDKKKNEKNNKLQVPVADKKVLAREMSTDKSVSDDERRLQDDSIFSDDAIEPVVLRPHKMNDSMNNHFSDDGSEDTSEEIFDRVMTRSSIRRSVKANPKYKKINRCKSKLLEQVKVNIID